MFILSTELMPGVMAEGLVSVIIQNPKIQSSSPVSDKGGLDSKARVTSRAGRTEIRFVRSRRVVNKGRHKQKGSRQAIIINWLAGKRTRTDAGSLWLQWHNRQFGKGTGVCGQVLESW